VSGNVVAIAPGADVQTSALEPPKHLRKAQRAAWDDLVSAADKSLHVKQNAFTFEIAATLLAKFRSGKPMTATESKELKKQMVALGLATDDDDKGKRKPRKNDSYFD
jgi:hypothetical protein